MTARGLAATSPRLLAAWLFLALCCLPPKARALLPEPSNFLFGSIAISNVLVGAERTDLVVEARRSSNSVPFASYQMGTLPQYGNMYFLEVPVETVSATRNPNAVTNGATIYIALHDAMQDLAVMPYQVSARGQFQRLNFFIVPQPVTGSFAGWAGVNGLSGDGSGDKDGDGVSDLSEYIAGTDPNDPSDQFKLDIHNTNAVTSVSFLARRAVGTGYENLDRFYSLESTTNLLSGAWVGINNRTNLVGNDTVITSQAPSAAGPIYFRGRVWLQVHQ